MTKHLGAVCAIAFLAAIVAANYVTTKLGMVSVGFGLTATAGTYLAGLTFILRDTIQDTLGRRAVVRLILAGAALSVLLAATVFKADETFLPPGVTAMSIALASGVAFLASEVLDWLIYSPLRTGGYIRAAVASNVVGAVVDTFLFLWIAGFSIAGAWQGQVVGKLTVTAVAAGCVLVASQIRGRRAAVAA